jgi:hypothetical protein
MNAEFDSQDFFCRINVQAEMPHEEFVSFLARQVGGCSRMNAVRSRTLDILVDENDVFDAAKSHTGADRWLYFRYTLEVDPVKGVAAEDYIASVGALLKSLWTACMDAVASCDFEDRLPGNERRLKWANKQAERTTG